MLTWSEAYYASEWLIRLVMLFYVPTRRSPAAARTWLLLIFLLPWPGLIVYMAIGRIHFPKERLALQARAQKLIRAARDQMGVAPAWSEQPSPIVARAAALVQRLGEFVPRGGNEIGLLWDYQATIDALIGDIKNAKYHVHLLFYIFENDSIGRAVSDALIAAAKRGVKCRVLMDAVGAKRGLRRLAPRLRENGVDVQAALPVGLFRRNTARIDLRNHRKIAVIDGRIGYTGSQNVVEPYFVRDCPNEELMARVTGPVVVQLQTVLLADYYFETGTIIDEPELFPHIDPIGSSAAQVLPSGPGYGHENAQELMVDLLHAADRRIVITTPYFVPDEPFLQAMRTAVLRGVEVHLVLPEHSNQPFTRLAQQGYLEGLLDAGIIIHLYKPHFLHAKHMSIDGEIALVGSSNIDIRSFALNAEISLLIYDPAVVARLREVQNRYFAHGRVLTKEEWAERSTIARTIQNLARLADALL